MMAKARLTCHLWIDCPNCDDTIDLLDEDPDYVISNALFNNKWDDLKGYEVNCGCCDHDFVIDEIEY
jgi:hypothetical protein